MRCAGSGAARSYLLTPETNKRAAAAAAEGVAGRARQSWLDWGVAAVTAVGVGCCRCSIPGRGGLQIVIGNGRGIQQQQRQQRHRQQKHHQQHHRPSVAFGALCTRLQPGLEWTARLDAQPPPSPPPPSRCSTRLFDLCSRNCWFKRFAKCPYPGP